MSIWPFKRAKQVSQPDLLSVLSGGGLPVGAMGLIEDVSKSAALETAASMWANAMGSASGPLPSDCLSWLGRELILRGQGVLMIDTSMGRLRFIPVWQVDIDGFGPFPESWKYRCTVNSPDSSFVRLVSGDGVIHLMWASDPVRPWIGVRPSDTTTASTLGSIEGRVSKEAKTAFGYILPYKDRRGNPLDNQVEGEGYDFAKLNGRLVSVTGTPPELGGQPSGNPAQRFTSIRLGFEPPPALVAFRKDIERSVLMTCQIPEALVSAADGTSQREAYRRFVVMAVEPVLKRLSSELEMKLDLTPKEASFDVHCLHAHDIQGRASAFQRLVAAGKNAEEASRLAGLMVPDDM